MRIAKIKNIYMYKTRKDDQGSHHYLVFFDRKNRRYDAVQLTHLYKKDEKRFAKIRNGLLLKEKFKEFDVPSGVGNQIYASNTSGGKIDLKDKRNVTFVSKRHISKKQKARIERFLARKKAHK